MTGRILAAQTVVLVAVSLAVLYPVVAYARTLLYTEAVTMLSVSLLVFTIGSVVDEGLGMVTASEGIYLLSSLCFATAVWLFAREFVRINEGSFAVDDSISVDGPSGFADADTTATDTVTEGFGNAPEREDGD